MKIAICSETEEINGLVPMTFREAKYLMIIETKTNELQYTYIREDEENIGFAEHIVEHDCEAVICGAIEERPFNMIVAAGITRYDGSTRKVQKAYTYMLRGKLPLIRDYVGGHGAVGHSHDHSCDCGHGEEEEVVISDRFDAVITAGGMSSRMGDFKPLMELEGEKLILRQIRTFLSAGVEQVIVVIGNRGNEIQKAVEDALGSEQKQVRFVLNPAYSSTPMFESVRLGLMAAAREDGPQDHHGIFFVPVDSPLFTKFTVDTLMDYFSYTPKSICIPTCDGADGHPLLIRGNAVRCILEGDQSQGLRSALQNPELSIARVEVPDRGILLDADTPEDFRILQEELKLRRSPDEKTCERILAWAGVSSEICKHGRLVGQKAAAIAESCRESGLSSDDIKKIYTAGILHDILKGMDRHAERAGELLKDLDMEEIGHLVSTHTNLPEKYLGSINGNLIIYLADKLISGDREVTLDERFAVKREKFRNQKAALAAVESRYQSACRALELVRRAGWQG